MGNSLFETYLSSLPSNGFLGSGSLFRVLHPFKPFTDAPVTEACETTVEMNAINLCLLLQGHVM